MPEKVSPSSKSDVPDVQSRCQSDVVAAGFSTLVRADERTGNSGRGVTALWPRSQAGEIPIRVRLRLTAVSAVDEMGDVVRGGGTRSQARRRLSGLTFAICKTA